MLKELDTLSASCKNNTIPTSMFFEEFEEIDYHEKMKVVSICNSCKIKDDCLEYALSHKESYGLWGGKFFKKGNIIDIRTLRRPRPAKSSI